jgi:hypothetical protein
VEGGSGRSQTQAYEDKLGPRPREASTVASISRDTRRPSILMRLVVFVSPLRLVVSVGPLRLVVSVSPLRLVVSVSPLHLVVCVSLLRLVVSVSPLLGGVS